MCLSFFARQDFTIVMETTSGMRRPGGGREGCNNLGQPGGKEERESALSSSSNVHSKRWEMLTPKKISRQPPCLLPRISLP